MKIDANSPVVSQLPVDRAPNQVSKNNLAGPQGATEDRITLSSDNSSIKSLTIQALNTPEIRQDKVDSFRQSISSGDYKLDSTKTAEAIIASNGQ